MWRSGRTRPVSGSTSTIETCAPKGNVALGQRVVGGDRQPALVLVGVRRELLPGQPRVRGRPRPRTRRRRGPRRRARPPASVRPARRPSPQLVGGLADRVAADLQRPRSARAAAGRDQRGVGLLVGDVVEGDAEPVGGDHREARRVPLAVRGGAGTHGGGAVVVHHDLAVLRPAEPGDLDVRRQADAEQPALARVDAAPLLRPGRLDVGDPQRLGAGRGRSRRCRRSRPVLVLNGNASGWMKLRRRISSGASPSSSAATSIIRSMQAAASGRPAPRKAPTGAVLVITPTRVEPQLGDVVDALRHQVRRPDGQRAAEAGVRPALAEHAQPQARRSGPRRSGPARRTAPGRGRASRASPRCGSRST